MFISAPRLRLRCWAQVDRDVFAAMHAHPDVMHDYGGPISRSESDAKLNRYMATYQEHSFSRWAVEAHVGEFLGYAGITPVRPRPSPRFTRTDRLAADAAWGFGYATEAAQAALTDAFIRIGLDAVIAYTAADNLRSQAVMTRLQMRRDPSSDFTADYATIKGWRGLVWEARRGG